MPGGGKKAVFPTLALHDHEQVRVAANEQEKAKRLHQTRGKSSEGGKDSPEKETPKVKNKNPPKTGKTVLPEENFDLKKAPEKAES